MDSGQRAKFWLGQLTKLTRCFSFLPLAVSLLIFGCGEKDSQLPQNESNSQTAAPNADAVEQSDEPLRLYLLVYNGGQPFMGFDGNFLHDVRGHGYIHMDGGGTVKCSFTERGGTHKADIDLKVQETEDEKYRVNGVLTSTVPVSLEFWGTTEGKNATNETFHFKAGTNNIFFEGKLYYTYNR